MSANPSSVTLTATVDRKTYEIDPKDLPRIRTAVARGWAPLIRGLRAQLNHTQELWTLHRDLREGSGFTARVVEAVARTGLPKQGLLDAAVTSLARLEQVVARGDFAGIPDAYKQAHAAVHEAVSTVQDYHEAISERGEDCVTALKAIKAASKIVLDICGDLVTLGQPQFKAPMAAALGSYEELLDQIEAAQTDKSFDVRRAAAVVLGKGALEGAMKHLMNDGQVGKVFVDKIGAGFAKELGKHCGNAAAIRMLQKMLKSGMEDGVKEALSEVYKQCAHEGKKLSLGEALEKALKKAATKAGVLAFLGQFDKELEAVNDTVLRRIGDGAIKGFKVDSPKAARELKVLVEDTAAKLAVKFVEQNADEPAKLAAMAEAVAKQVLGDAAFKSAAAKLGGQKAR